MNAEKWHHSEIRIAINDESQGSIAKNLRCDQLLYYTFIIHCWCSVATRLGRGGVFVYDFVTNFLLSLTVKEF